jgi:hypothetical protein
MAIEGGGTYNYQEIPRRRHERRWEQESSWIAGIINPGKLEILKAYPVSEGHSTEWIIMQELLGKLVVSGPEMDPHIRTRLENLVAVFRALMIPNLTEGEQKLYKELASATTTGWSSLQTEVTQDTIGDVQELWHTFNLKVPSRNQMRSTMGDAGEIMH